MLSKFETKSSRVKGLAFHPKRPWILASLHNGSIQLWDYKMGILIDRFDEHEGPVRGIAFHPSQPLFVSGGDDYKIKVWNWKTRRCLFTLTGHIDYIRTVFFHHENPWILSASDDQTLRIWNWQSRNCISILTGHNHYVMCAQFHPKEDLIVSASLDQTIRVWDIAGLRKKHAAGPTAAPAEFDHYRGGPGAQADLFGNTDAAVKFVLEGHDRGVNWVQFHPTLPFIVSGSDDRTIKLWRMNETRAWEVNTFRAHYNNVSSVLFHPRQEIIISNSEDKTIRIWDMPRAAALQTFRRESDRFWIVAAHPELNLFAAGHDGGLIVFKLERERPAHSLHQNNLYYCRDKELRLYDLSTADDSPILTLQRGNSTQMQPPKTMSYNPAEHAVLMTSTKEGGTYELLYLAKGTSGSIQGDPKRGTGQSAVFVARNRFAVLDKQAQTISIKDMNNEVVRVLKPPVVVNDMFFGGGRTLLLTSATSVVLFDMELRSTIAELTVNGVRSAVWSPDMSLVALLSKHTLVIADKQLEQLCLIHETIKIKSGVWDEVGSFIYTTLNHIKYTLPYGDNGIIRTIDQPVYLAKAKGKNITCLDREGRVRVFTIDPTDYRFKLALEKKNYNEVLHLIRTSNLVGQSIIAYLQRKGYPEVALHFVKDPTTRFELAIECGNLQVALETAKAVDKEECWRALAEASLKQGNHQILEMAYQRTKNFERLSFLYLVTGNMDKLRKMLKIAEMRNDHMSRYHNALYLGDVDKQVALLKEVGQLPLAYLAARTHGLAEEANEILAAAGRESEPDMPQGGELLKTPTPILRQHDINWPHLPIARSFFEEGLLGNAPADASQPTAESELMQEANQWANAEADAAQVQSQAADTGDSAGEVMPEGGGWDFGGDFELPTASAETAPVTAGDSNTFVPPLPGKSFADNWVQNSALAADHAAAGSFDSAMQLLNRQIGAANFAPLRPLFMQASVAAKAYIPANASVPPLALPLQRAGSRSLPAATFKLTDLTSKLQEAYAATTAGKFSDALMVYKSVLYSIILTVVDTVDEEAQIQQLVDTCREYILGLKMDLTRRTLSLESDPTRVLELAAYYTHCHLQPAHLQLTLLQAASLCAKVRNLALASLFARRLLELNPPQGLGQKARAIIQHCGNNPTDSTQIEYDQYNPFVVCGISYTPIYRGSPSVQCPFCRTSYKPEHSGTLCSICEISRIGAPASGFRCRQE